MAPKAKRERSKSKGRLPKLAQASTSSASLNAEESFSGSVQFSASFSDASPATTEPSSPMSVGGASASGEASPKGRKGRRSKKKDVEEVKEHRPARPVYNGPPPDEEFLDDVLTQVKTKDAWREADWLESLHINLREGEVGIGQEVNTRNLYGFTPLAVAAAAGESSLVALLLEHRADVRLASTGRSELPLHHAANYRHRVVTQLLAEPCQKLGLIDARTSTGWTPLHTCANSGDKDVFKILMRAKADLEARNPITGNEHALHVAARASNLDIIEILLAADADVNCKDSLSRTPLHLAATMSHADCVGLLLRSRADALHIGGPSQCTPIECVPLEHHDADERDTVIRLLTSYRRPPPSPPRMDIRFDLSDHRDLI